MKRWFLCSSLIFMAVYSHGQFHKTPDSFVKHLLNKKLYKEAITVLEEKILYAQGTKRDTLQLLLGKTYYSLQQLPQSIQQLDRVSSENNSLFAEAMLFSAFNESYLGKTDASLAKLRAIYHDNRDYQQLRYFEMAGNYLLQNEFRRFDSLSLLLDGNWSVIQQQCSNFSTYKQELKKLKSRSPFLAGSLSTVLPGAGKWYAGKRGNAIYTFLISGILAAQTWEAYRKDGIESARFIIYGTLFTSFYIGNIWGSALAVKISTNEKRDAITSQVLFDMHIPLRTFFQ